MPLQQLQGLTPLGGSGGYGQGRPPSGDGTDPNDPNAQHPPQSQRRPQQAPLSSPAPAQAPTFSDLAAQGRARPAPPSAMSPTMPHPLQPPQQVAPQALANQANSAASQALANPSAYGAPQVQQAMHVLDRQLQTDQLLGRRSIDETMATRGLYDSTATGDKYGQLQAQQDTARANYATQLANTAAQTYGTDRTNAIAAAGTLQNQQATQGLAQQAQNLNAALGYGQLGVSQGALTGSYNGQSTLGAQALGLQAQQQAQNYALGQGQLGVSQQQANTGAQSVANQASQFGQSFGLQSLQNQQQYGLNQQQLALNSALGYGNLGVAQQGANTAQQATQNQFTLGQGQLGLAQTTQAQNNALAQQTLAQQGAYQQGQLGLGQNQINASLLNQERQSIGNLAYAGLQSATPQAPPQSWLDFLMGGSGSNSVNATGMSSYIPPGGGGSGGTGASGTGGTGGAGGIGAGGGTNVTRYAPTLFNGTQGGYDGTTGAYAPDPNRQPVTPTQTNDPLDQWWSQTGNGPRYSNANGTTVDNALLAMQSYQNMSPQQQQQIGFASTPAMQTAYQSAKDAADQRYQYGLTHGGFDMGQNNPNARTLQQILGYGSPQ